MTYIITLKVNGTDLSTEFRVDGAEEAERVFHNCCQIPNTEASIREA